MEGDMVTNGGWHGHVAVTASRVCVTAKVDKTLLPLPVILAEAGVSVWTKT